jgi:8-oxo-dGTP diphosphatase
MIHNFPRVGVGVLIFNNRGQLLLSKRIRGHGKFTYGTPGGHLEFGESFEDCAIREVMEETGLKITSPKFFAITNDLFKDENKHYISVFMKATLLDKNSIPQNRETSKHMEWCWFDMDKLPDFLFLPLKKLMTRSLFYSIPNML